MRPGTFGDMIESNDAVSIVSQSCMGGIIDGRGWWLAALQPG